MVHCMGNHLFLSPHQILLEKLCYISHSVFGLEYTFYLNFTGLCSWERGNVGRYQDHHENILRRITHKNGRLTSAVYSNPIAFETSRDVQSKIYFYEISSQRGSDAFTRD